MKTFKIQIFLAILVLYLTSCGIYSFTGASIPPGAKTVSVDYFKYSAQYFNASLSQELTEGLKNKLTSQTPLSLINGKGDLQFKGEIVDYSTGPVGLIAGETAAKNRLTIKVKVEFINEVDETFNYTQTFSRYADYESNKILSSVEPDILPGIIDELTDDIFQKAVVNW